MFAAVFKQAWVDTVKMSDIINAFRGSGICPFNPLAIDETKLAPSLPFSVQSKKSQLGTPAAELVSLQKLMRPETLQHFEERYSEGYDLDTDEYYVVWSKLKALSISEDKSSDTNKAAEVESSESSIPQKQQYISPTLPDILTYPQPKNKKTGKPTSNMPKHMSSLQMINFLEEKELKKKRQEEEKERRKSERELKRKEREAEKQRKILEREQRKEAAKVRGQKSGGRKGGSENGNG